MAEHSTDAAWLDRVRGLLLGGALGDALGAPFEGAAEVDPSRLDRLVESDDPLCWTDDTALQLALAEHLADSGADDEVDDDELAVVLARAWQAEPWRGYGANPPRIFASVLAGATGGPRPAGPSAARGRWATAMRCGRRRPVFCPAAWPGSAR
jgi:poly(ADP-ribose) glycohydrolase ARH3